MRTPDYRQFRVASRLEGTAREQKIRDIALALVNTGNLNGFYAAWDSGNPELCSIASAAICLNIPEMVTLLYDEEFACEIACILAKQGLTSSDPAIRGEAIPALQWIALCGGISSIAKPLSNLVGQFNSDDFVPEEFEQILDLHADIAQAYGPFDQAA